MQNSKKSNRRRMLGIGALGVRLLAGKTRGINWAPRLIHIRTDPPSRKPSAGVATRRHRRPVPVSRRRSRCEERVQGDPRGPGSEPQFCI